MCRTRGCPRAQGLTEQAAGPLGSAGGPPRLPSFSGRLSPGVSARPDAVRAHGGEPPCSRRPLGQAPCLPEGDVGKDDRGAALPQGRPPSAGGQGLEPSLTSPVGARGGGLHPRRVAREPVPAGAASGRGVLGEEGSAATPAISGSRHPDGDTEGGVRPRGSGLVCHLCSAPAHQVTSGLCLNACWAGELPPSRDPCLLRSASASLSVPISASLLFLAGPGRSQPHLTGPALDSDSGVSLRTAGPGLGHGSPAGLGYTVPAVPV